MFEWTFYNSNGSNPAVMSKAQRYAEDYQQMKERNIGLLFWGNTGTGKSYTAACIANYLIDMGNPVFMISFGRILREQFAAEDKSEYLEHIIHYPMLILDDLGAERDSAYAQEVVYSVIDGRYLTGKPLIITSNLTLDELKAPSDMRYSRIYDRILEMCVPIHFEGTSQRQDLFKSKRDMARDLLESEAK